MQPFKWQNGTATLENNLAVPQMVKYRVTFWLGNSTPRNSPRKIENICPHKNVNTNIHRSIIDNIQKVETTQVSLNWQMDKQKWYIHTTEYYLVIKRNEHEWITITWMNLENIMLRNQSHTKKPLIIWFHLYEVSRMGKYRYIESWFMIA